MRDPFWQSAKILLGYKRRLALALLGALVSAACLGAGISMVLPALQLMLANQQPLDDLVRNKLINPDQPQLINDIGQWLLPLIPGNRYHAFLLVMGGIGVLAVIGSCGRFFHQLITITVVQHAAMVWRSRMFARLINLPFIELLTKGSGDHMSRVVFDTRPLVRSYRALLGKLVEQVLKGMVGIFVAAYVNLGLTMTALVCAPPIAILLSKFGKRIRRAARRALRQRGRMVTALRELTTGIHVVKVHNAEGYERRRFGRMNRKLFNEEMKKRTVVAMATPVVDTLGLFGVLLVASIAAYTLHARHAVEPAHLMTVLLGLSVAAGSLRPLATLNSQINEGRAAAERILALIELVPEPTGPGTRRDLPPLPRHCRSIAFEGVSFTYPGQSPAAVVDLSLRIPHGTTVAIVGPNGSGKTTLLSMLPRLLEPDEGHITVDGTDIGGVALRSLREQIAVVTQQTVLFEGTIAQNIAYGRRHESHDRIVAAAKTAYVHSFVDALPSGYDTPLAEHGEGLSGGQRQRLCIARAILRDPAILILDEATSQVDSDSEAKINRALRDLRRGRTVFVIAHRLSTVVDADLIAVMDGGRLVDQGNHEELLDRCQVYRTLTHTQLQPPAA